MKTIHPRRHTYLFRDRFRAEIGRNIYDVAIDDVSENAPHDAANDDDDDYADGVYGAPRV